MELRHLRYFLTVAEERQLTRAAVRLHIQQPPLSQQIHELEHELGFSLFRRLPRGVELTVAGEAFAADARIVFDALTHGIQNARRMAHGEIGTVRVGLSVSAGFHPLPTAAIRAFRDANPHIEIALTETDAEDIVAQMMSQSLDVAMLRKPAEMPSELRLEVLHDEAMVLVLPIGHPLLLQWREQDHIPLDALREESFILVRRPGTPSPYAGFVKACEEQGFKPQIAKEVPRSMTAINLVASGTGVTLVPASMRQYHSESVAYRQLEGDRTFTAPLYLARRCESGNPAAIRFAEAVMAYKNSAGPNLDFSRGPALRRQSRANGSNKRADAGSHIGVGTTVSR